MSIVGVADGLRFELRWETSVGKGAAAEATRGTLAVWLGPTLVWGVGRPDRTTAEGIEWSWIDLLEHLARRWMCIVWEEIDPLGFGLLPSKVRKAAQDRWSSLAEEKRDSEQRAVLRYEEAHNLAAALPGASPPSLWISREGNRMALSSGNRSTRWRPVPEVVRTLAALGDEIAARLKNLVDERAHLAVNAWAQRDKQDPDRLVSVAASFPLERIRELRGQRPANEFWGLTPDSDAPTQMMVAARMLSPAAPDVVTSRVLEWIRAQVHAATPDLDAMSVEAIAIVRESGPSRSFEMGYRLATWWRSIPGIASADGRVDPDQMLRNYGVEITEESLGWPHIDAVCCWGGTKGPAILVNRDGEHAQRYEGLRTSLAHEFCHLLVDRHRSLPVAEVLGGRCPVFVEQRANAFAAELLLPREVAGALLTASANHGKAVSSARRMFGVSAEIVAWQALRSSRKLKLATFNYLKDLVSDPDRFEAAYFETA